MLTPPSLWALKSVITLTKWCKSTTMEWDSKTSRVRLNKSKLANLLCVLSSVVMVLYELFLLHRVAEVVWFPKEEGKETPLSEIVNLCYNVCAYAIPISLHYCTFRKRTEIPVFINGYISFYERFKVLWLTPRGSQQKVGCEKLVKGFLIVAGLIVVQNLVIMLRAPSRSFLLTSLFVDEKGKLPTVGIKLLTWTLHLQIWTNLWSQLLTYGTILYTYIYPAIRIISELNPRTRKCYTYDVLISPGNFKRVYKQLLVLQNMFNFCLQHDFFSYHKLSISAAAVFAIYGAIKIRGPRAVLMAMVAIMACTHLGFILRQAGKMYAKSAKVLESWRGRGRAMRRDLRACHAIQVEISGYYHVQKSTVLVIFGVIVNAAITLLLSS